MKCFFAQGFAVSHFLSAVREATLCAEESIKCIRQDSVLAGLLTWTIYCDNCMEPIHGGPLHREPWSSEKDGDVLTVNGNMAPGQGLRGEQTL